MMTTFSAEDVKKTAHLARLSFSEAEAKDLEHDLSGILSFAAKINTVDTNNVEPISHPLELKLRVREDKANEPNQREAFQALAPSVEAGLYLVPQVIE